MALKGRFVASRGDARLLGELLDGGIKLYEAATNGLWGVGAYAGLASSIARNDPAWSKFEGDLRARSSQIAAESLFFTLELNELDDNESRGGVWGAQARGAGGRGSAASACHGRTSSPRPGAGC